MTSPSDASSILGQLVHNVSDVSEPGLSLTLERSRQARYLPVTPNHAWALNKEPAVAASLNLGSLVPLFFVLPVGYMAVLYALFQLSSLGFRRLASGKSLFRRLRRRVEAVLCVVLAILLGALQTEMVIQFNSARREEPFGSLEDFVQRLESCGWSGVSNSRVNQALILEPLSFRGVGPLFDRLIAAAARNPPIVASIADCLDLVRQGRHVMVTGAGSIDRYMVNGTELCGLRMKPLHYFPRGEQQMYLRTGLGLGRRMTDGDRKVYAQLAGSLRRRYETPRLCGQDHRRNKAQLSLDQIQDRSTKGAFLILLICLAAASVGLAAEVGRMRCRQALVRPSLLERAQRESYTASWGLFNDRTI